MLRLFQNSYSLRYLKLLFEHFLLDEVLHLLECGQTCWGAYELVIIDNRFELVLLLLQVVRHCSIEEVLLVSGRVIAVIVENLLIVGVSLVPQGFYYLV